MKYEILMSTNIKGYVKTHPQTMVCYHEVEYKQLQLVAQRMPWIDRLNYVFVYATPAHLSNMHRKIEEEKLVYKYYVKYQYKQVNALIARRNI